MKRPPMLRRARKFLRDFWAFWRAGKSLRMAWLLAGRTL